MKKSFCLYLFTLILLFSNLISFCVVLNYKKSSDIKIKDNDIGEDVNQLPEGYYSVNNFRASNTFALNDGHIEFTFEGTANIEIDSKKIFSTDNTFEGGEILSNATIGGTQFNESIRINNVDDNFVFVDLLETTKIYVSLPIAPIPYDFNLFKYQCFLNGIQKTIVQSTRSLNYTTGNFDLIIYIQNDGNVYSGSDVSYRIDCFTTYRDGYYIPVNYIDFIDNDTFLHRLVYYSQKPCYKLEKVEIEGIDGFFAKVAGDWLKPSLKIVLPS